MDYLNKEQVLEFNSRADFVEAFTRRIITWVQRLDYYLLPLVIYRDDHFIGRRHKRTVRSIEGGMLVERNIETIVLCCNDQSRFVDYLMRQRKGINRELPVIIEFSLDKDVEGSIVLVVMKEINEESIYLKSVRNQLKKLGWAETIHLAEERLKTPLADILHAKAVTFLRPGKRITESSIEGFVVWNGVVHCCFEEYEKLKASIDAPDRLKDAYGTFAVMLVRHLRMSGDLFIMAQKQDS